MKKLQTEPECGKLIVKDGWLDGFSELSEPERIKDQAIYFDRTSMTVYLTDLEA